METIGHSACWVVAMKLVWAQIKITTKDFEFFTKSAEQGNSLAICGIGFCYKVGFGCDKNDTKLLSGAKKVQNWGSVMR